MTWICGWITTPTAADPTARAESMRRVSSVDNVEYIVVDNPPAGTYRLKVVPVQRPGLRASLWHGRHDHPRRSDSGHDRLLTAPSNPTVGSTFGVTLNVSTPSYVASGVQVELTAHPARRDARSTSRRCAWMA